MYYVLLFSLHARSYAEVSSMTFPFPGLGYGNFFWENAQAHNLESYLILYQILCYLGGAGCTKEKNQTWSRPYITSAMERGQSYVKFVEE